MTAQAVPPREPIEYLADIVKGHDDIPAGALGRFQTRDYARRQDAQIKAAPIN